jgi:hypothetical protein
MALRTVPNPVTAVNVSPFHSIWMRKAEGDRGRAREPHHVSRGFVYQGSVLAKLYNLNAHPLAVSVRLSRSIPGLLMRHRVDVVIVLAVALAIALFAIWIALRVAPPTRRGDTAPMDRPPLTQRGPLLRIEPMFCRGPEQCGIA